MRTPRTLAYPRRPLYVALALAAAVAVGSIGVSGIPAPALSLGWYGGGLCDDGEALNPGAPSCRYDGRESSCEDRIDNDSDERTDCLDSECAADSACTGIVCGDGVCDRGESGICGGDCGSTVCGDGECTSPEQPSGCPEDCGAPPACIPATEVCGNGADEDCDGSDPACGCPWWNPWCDESQVDVCPNIDGAQASVPQGLVVDAAGNCVPIENCDGTKVCDQSCPEYDLCTCDPGHADCQGGGGGGGEEGCLTPCDDATCAGYDACECLGGAACGAEVDCGDGVDNDADGSADCQDGDCGETCDEDVRCEDADACNAGGLGACVCDCDGVDNDGNGDIDEAGESCGEDDEGDGCSDSNATNYDSAAPVGGDRDETCEYKMEQSVSIYVSDSVARGPGSWLAAAAAGSLEDLLAADPGNIQGFVVALRVSLSKTTGGNMRFTISSQVAPETGSGKWPMGYIQAGPTFSFTKSGLVPTPPYVSDDVTQAYIHQAIDGGFYGEKAAMMHSILQKTTDVWHYVHGND